jgi:hypothetical protein
LDGSQACRQGSQVRLDSDRYVRGGGEYVYSTTLNSNISTFQMPANLLKRGGDYYISVAASDATTFGKYAITRFRLTGSLWEDTVSNAAGWTVETAFTLAAASTFAEDKYQVVRFQDGSKFGEIRIYADRIRFASEEVLESNALDLTGMNILTIAGQGSNVKVYFNRALVIDGTGKLTQESTSKRLEVGTTSAPALDLNYKSLYYATSGRYDPGDSSAWNSVQFYSLADFKANEISAIEGVLRGGQNLKLVGVNPHDESQGGAVYEIAADRPARFATVNQSFTPINRVGISADAKYKAFSHARGGSVFYSYLITNWDHDSDFTDEDSKNPSENGWELVENTGFSSVSLDGSGLMIDTSFGAIGRMIE